MSQNGARCLPDVSEVKPKTPVIGVVATSDPRVDEESRQRCRNIAHLVADRIAGKVRLPDGTAAPVVYTQELVDGERGADVVAQQFREAGVDILICVPDTWAFPQLTLISLLQQLPADIPVNITCGNSGPKPGVVYAHAVNGALAQYGRQAALNVGSWPDTGQEPKMSDATAEALINWCYAAVTAVALRGRRIVIFGHDSMGMETALAHVIPARNTFGIEITRLDMKLLADMLRKEAFNKAERKELRAWLDKHLGERLEMRDAADSERFDASLGMYLIVRDLMAGLNAVGGGFMSQLEWGSDSRGLPLPVADAMESLFNSTFDHQGRKAPIPYATEADVQGLLTMLFMTYLSGGHPPLFMDFRKVWESWEILELAGKLGIKDIDRSADYCTKGLVDGDNSGSAALDWAAAPGADIKAVMQGVSMPLADTFYFPGGGNSVTFMTPGGIEGIAGRLTYSGLTGMFSVIWDEAHTTEVPEKLAKAMCELTTPTWPHTFVVPKYASMAEYKQYAPATHFHMTWNLEVARLEHWMDLTNVLSVTPWAARPGFIEGVDRPAPLVHLINGNEPAYKMLRSKGR
jgi:L-fucose/D-arabinose isomerase